jgi:uncharacterized protein (DUF1778 family)
MRQSEYCLASITTRVPPEALEAVERAAAAERRSVSSLLRNVVCDWAARRQPQHSTQEGR